MENAYEWLCDNYAELRREKLPACQERLTEPLLAAVPKNRQLFCTDTLNTLRMDWCTGPLNWGLGWVWS